MQAYEMKVDVSMKVVGYDEGNDVFEVLIYVHPNPPHRGTVPAALMPILAEESGEPSDFIGRCFNYAPINEH